MKNACQPVVVENFFEPCILYLLLTRKSYGYDIQKQLKSECGCNVNVGNLYRCLAKLMKAGYITKSPEASTIGPKRIVYAITPKGKTLLASWIGGLEKQADTINSLIRHYRRAVKG